MSVPLASLSKKTNRVISKSYTEKSFTTSLNGVCQAVQNNEPSRTNAVLNVVQCHAKNTANLPPQQELQIVLAPKKIHSLCKRGHSMIDRDCRVMVIFTFVVDDVKLFVSLPFSHSDISYGLESLFSQFSQLVLICEGLQHFLSHFYLSPVDFVNIYACSISSQSMNILSTIKLSKQVLFAYFQNFAFGTYFSSPHDFVEPTQRFARRVFISNGYNCFAEWNKPSTVQFDFCLGYLGAIEERILTKLFFSKLRKVSNDNHLLSLPASTETYIEGSCLASTTFYQPCTYLESVSTEKSNFPTIECTQRCNRFQSHSSAKPNCFSSSSCMSSGSLSASSSDCSSSSPSSSCMSSGSLSASGSNGIKKDGGRDKKLVPRLATPSRRDKESSPRSYSKKEQMKKCSDFVKPSPLYSTVIHSHGVSVKANVPSTDASSCEQSSSNSEQLDNSTKEAQDQEDEFNGRAEFPSMSKATLESKCKDTLYGEMLPNPMLKNNTHPATREKPQEVEAPKIPDMPIPSHTTKDRLPGTSHEQVSSAVTSKLSLVPGTLPTVGSPPSKAQLIHSAILDDSGGGQVGKGGVSTDGRSSSHATVRKKSQLAVCHIQSTQEDPLVSITPSGQSSPVRKKSSFQKPRLQRANSVPCKALKPERRWQEGSQPSVTPSGQSSSVRKKPTGHPYLQRANSCPYQSGEPLAIGGIQKSRGNFQTSIAPSGQSSSVRKKADPIGYPTQGFAHVMLVSQPGCEVAKQSAQCSPRVDCTTSIACEHHSSGVLPGENSSQQLLQSDLTAITSQTCSQYTYNCSNSHNAQQSSGSHLASPAAMVVASVNEQLAQSSVESREVLAHPTPVSCQNSSAKLLIRQCSYTEVDVLLDDHGAQDNVEQRHPPQAIDTDPIGLEESVQVSQPFPVDSFCLLLNGVEYLSRRAVPPASDDFPVDDGDGPLAEAQLLPFQEPPPAAAILAGQDTEHQPLSAMHIDGNNYQCFNTLAGVSVCEQPAVSQAHPNQQTVSYEGLPYAVMCPAPVRYCRGYRERIV